MIGAALQNARAAMACAVTRAVMAMPATALAAALSFITLYASSQPTVAQDIPQATLIFDGSGSMWGRLGERSKYDIARDVTSQVLPKTAGKIALGLIAYGHRRKSDCNDIQTFARPSDGASQKLVDAIRALTPRGKTPIASSLEQAARNFDTSTPGHIILLTDGVENCRKDLCSATTELKEAAPNLTVSVIALGMRPRDLDRIACVASIGGGRFIKANNSTDLREGLAGVLAEIITPRQATTPAAAVPTGPPVLELRALRTARGPLIEEPVHWRVVQIDANEAEPRVLYDKTAAAPDVPVETGTFRIEATLGAVSVARDVVVAEAGRRSAHIPMQLAELRIDTANTLGPGETLLLTHTPPGNEPGLPPLMMRQGENFQKRLFLPEGVFNVIRQSDASSERYAIELSAGETKSVSFSRQFGQLKLNTTSAVPTAPTVIQVYELSEDTSPDTDLDEVARSASPAPSFTLPTGVYRVVARSGHATASQAVTVAAGRTTTQTITIEAGTLKLAASASGKPAAAVRYTVWSRDVAGQRTLMPVTATSQPSPSLHLSPGTYAIDATYGDTNLTATANATIKASETTSVDLTFLPATLTLNVTPDATKPIASTLAWSIRKQSDPAGPTIWSSTRRSPTVTLAPGSYTVTLSRADREVTQSVVLGANTQKTVTFKP